MKHKIEVYAPAYMDCNDNQQRAYYDEDNEVEAEDGKLAIQHAFYVEPKDLFECGIKDDSVKQYVVTDENGVVKKYKKIVK